MRLDPVYLVAPESAAKPDARSVSRRLFLGAVTTAAVSAFGAGWLVSSAASGSEAGRTVDEELRWAHGLATGSVEELARLSLEYLSVLWGYPNDSVLWRGFERLALHVVENDELERRSAIAEELLGTFETIPAPDRLRPLVPKLRTLVR